MKSIKTSIAMAAAVLAASGVMAANAADDDSQAVDSTNVPQVAQRTPTKSEKQFEFFETQLSLLSAPSYMPSEHPNDKPAPRSSHLTPSVFDNPINTASPG